jgi:very-short-patch-repair endonuclease
VTVHWRERIDERSRLFADPVTALRDLKGCASKEEYLVALDSVLHNTPQLRAKVERELGHRMGTLGIDGTCASGIETLCWIRLLRGLGARRQVRVQGVGIVDFVVGERLVIEVDGEEFHDTESTFDKDRRRDALLSILGYRVLRFSYRQVIERFEEVELAIRAAIARADHL